MWMADFSDAPAPLPKGENKEINSEELINRLNKVRDNPDRKTLEASIKDFLEDDGKLKDKEIRQLTLQLKGILGPKDFPTGLFTQQKMLDIAVKADLISPDTLLAIGGGKGGSEVPSGAENSESSLTEEQLLQRLAEIKHEQNKILYSKVKTNRARERLRMQSRSRANDAQFDSELRGLNEQFRLLTQEYWQVRREFEKKSGKNYSLYLREKKEERQSYVIRDPSTGEIEDTMTGSKVGGGDREKRSDTDANADDDWLFRNRGNRFAVERELRHRRAKQELGSTPSHLAGYTYRAGGEETVGYNEASDALSKEAAEGKGKKAPPHYKGRPDGLPFTPWGSAGERDEYLRKQDELRELYTPEVESFVEHEFPKHAEEYPALARAYARARAQWEGSPGRKYGDLAFMRSQIEFMQRESEFDGAMNARLQQLGEIPALDKMEIGSPGGWYFLPGEKIRITIPGNLLPYSNGKSVTVVYAPSEPLGVEADSQIEALMNAGIILKDIPTQTGTYGPPHNRRRVKGVDIYFTKEGRYVINGTPRPIGKEGKIDMKEELKGPVLAQREVSFGSNRPRLIHILDDNGETTIFDVRLVERGVRILDKDRRFAVTRLSGGGGNKFQIEFAEKGSFFVTGYEDQSGHAITAN